MHLNFLIKKKEDRDRETKQTKSKGEISIQNYCGFDASKLYLIGLHLNSLKKLVTQCQKQNLKDLAQQFDELNIL